MFAIIGKACNNLMRSRYPNFLSDHIIASFPISIWDPNSNTYEVDLKNEMGAAVFKLPVTKEFSVNKVTEEVNKRFISQTVKAVAMFINF